MVSHSTAQILVGVFRILLLLILLIVFSCWQLVFGAMKRPEQLECKNVVEALDEAGILPLDGTVKVKGFEDD